MKRTFSALDLDYRNHVEISAEYVRPTGITVSKADPEKANRQLGWKANFKLDDVIRLMLFGPHEETMAALDGNRLDDEQLVYQD